MALILLLLQTTAFAVAGFLGWRRLRALESEVARLRSVAAAQDAGAVSVRRRARGAHALHLAHSDAQPALFPTVDEIAPPAGSGGRDQTARARNAATLSPETARALMLAAFAIAPACGFLFGGAAAANVASGLMIAAGMMLVALRPLWRVAAWAGAITGASWALIGFALGAFEAAPVICAAAACAGLAGLGHAYLRRLAPGLTLALAMGAALLAIGSQIGLISAAGIAFGVIAAAAAVLGSLALRLEALHLAAFGAALIGLFVLSGQEAAAIWFTPAVTWTGALFLAIALVRVPYLGARGAALAGTGVLAPLAAVAALHISRHGLADPLAAGAALLAVAAALAGVLALTARRRPGGLAHLKLTPWVLAGGAFAAVAAALSVALPAPYAAGAFAAVALGLVLLNGIMPSAVWRTLAWAGGLGALINATFAAAWLLDETHGVEPLVLIGAGLAAPALLTGLASHWAARANAAATASITLSISLLLWVAAANLLLRLLASGGALLLTPISFAEAGLHIALWLTAALLVATRKHAPTAGVRRAFVVGLAALALGASVAATLLWLTPHWSERAPPDTAAALLRFDGLGFLAPAILFWAHWVYWRATGSELRTRIALGAGAMLTAALITLEVLQIREDGLPGTDWLGAGVGALVFALAIGVNFAPGVTAARAQRRSYFEENLHRHRRRHLRRQLR